MSIIEVDLVIIGGGVVGAAIAQELSRKPGKSILVLEKGPRLGEGVTGRNSGVIHAGIYYPPGSLKAETCIEGRKLLYEWCAEKNVPFKKTGKWIIARADEKEALEEIYENGIRSGVAELTISNQISSVLEGTHAASSIFSPETGIIDPYEYCKSLMQSAEDAGVSVITHAQVTGVERRTDGYLLHTTRGEVLAETVINSAGLQADEIARMVGIKTYTLYPCRGDYFRFRSPIQYTQLIYPVKQKNNPGLGVHLTLSLDGSQRLGPDAYYVDSKEDFSDPSPIDEKKQIFFEAAKKIFKNIDLSMLSCDSCGIRPKLRAPNGSKELDFVISKDLDGWINLMGIESPGLTAARAVARKVAGML